MKCVLLSYVTNHLPSCIFLLLFGGTGVWTQDFTLSKQMLHCFSHISGPFCSGYFGGGVLWTICLGWPWTMILLTLYSQVARVIGISHWLLAWFQIFFWQYWGLNTGPHACWAGFLHLSHIPALFCFSYLGIFLCLWLASDQDSPMYAFCIPVITGCLTRPDPQF
jgi:hypothetical protein